MISNKITAYTFPILMALLFFSCANEEKDLPISEIYLDIPENGYEVNIYDTITISPKITYDYGSSYTWLLDDEVISTEKNYILNPQELRTFNYTFTVENSRGSVSREITAQSMYTIDFEELELDEDTFSVGNIGSDAIASSLLTFPVDGDPRSYSSFDGFVFSNIQSTPDELLYQLYKSYRSPDSYKSTIYGILKQKDSNVPVTVLTSDGEDHLFKSIHINNTYFNYFAIEQGAYTEDGTEVSKPFGGDDGTDPDFFMLSIKGFNKNGTQRGTVNFYLADHRAESNKDDYTISEWTKVDLTELGMVSRIEFSLSSSDMANDQMRTPAFFCIDNIKIIE